MFFIKLLNFQKKMIYTIGHSTSEIQLFLNILKNKNTQILIDTRGIPYSRYVPSFNKDSLSENLENMGIKYHHVDCFSYNNVSTLIEPNTKQLKYLKRIVEIAETENIVLMGPHWNYALCHRNILAKWIITYFNKSVHHINIKTADTFTENKITGQISLWEPN